jgi:hypothetical protein
MLSVVSVVCLSGRGLCDGLSTRPEESYRLWCVLVCDLETSRLRRLKTRKWVVNASRKKNYLRSQGTFRINQMEQHIFYNIL